MGGGPTQGVILRDTSGEAVIVTSGRLLVDLSGTTITATTNISGQVPNISGQVVQISGQVVNISGFVNTSGQVNYEYGTSLRTAGLTQATNLSGGVFLGSGSVISVNIISISGNAPMWVGGTGSFAPVSGTGLILYGGGTGLNVKVNDVGAIRVFAETSGQFVSWLGAV